MSYTIFVSHPSHFLTDCHPHGDGLIAFSFLERLAKRGHTVHVACPLMEIAGTLHPNITIHPVKTWFPPSSDNPSPPHRLEYALQVRRLFDRLSRNIRFDVIHQLNPVVAGMSLFLGARGVPLVLGPIPPPWPDLEGKSVTGCGFLRDAIVKSQFKLASAVIVPTHAALASLPSNASLRKKLWHVNYGIDADHFSPLQREAAPRAPRTILFLANLLRRKGIFTLLDAFEQVANSIPDVRLTIAGDGRDADEVSERVRTHRYSARIDSIGRISREGAADTFRKATVYCLPSHGEPFGMTALEAMACGKPVIATNAGGLADLIREEGGKTVRPQDSGALAKALTEILCSDESQREMGRFNRLKVEREYAWDCVMERWEHLYSNVVNGATATEGALPKLFREGQDGC